ncbi:uncharacterized protein ARMOST_18117 [Armillaria ostoyae]|uniref:Reverse transcriptase domain-containing protein n=1 Tax=Armillaria ostoyae TaxID=47428 RepID=A0A284S0W5_ARMOS|nr:uncharacterized protein ARMOST_18117 [Armillaria ostoyae]
MPNVLIDSTNPIILIVNTSFIPKMIKKGEVLGMIKEANKFFDEAGSQDHREAMSKTASLIKKVVTMSQHVWETAGDSQKQEEEGDPKTDQYGPKMAAMPENEILSSTDIKSLLDIGDLPPELEEEAWGILKHHVRAFGFDGRLGNYPAEIKIPTKEGTQPISLPMYVSLLAKREVIDQQTETWFKKGIIEPSKSLWGAPIVIVYRNGKLRFCIDYRKLNAITILDEFPIPRQADILAALSGSQALSSLDALAEFMQLKLHEDNIEKTAFHSHRGLFQF